MGLLGLTLCVCLSLICTVNQFSKVVPPIYFPISSSESSFPHPYQVSVCLLPFSHAVVCVWYCVVSLLCISLMTSEGQHPFIHLFATWILFFETCLFKSFALCKSCTVFFPLLICKSWITCFIGYMHYILFSLLPFSFFF